jgi:hypothetical protein
MIFPIRSGAAIGLLRCRPPGGANGDQVDWINGLRSANGVLASVSTLT